MPPRSSRPRWHQPQLKTLLVAVALLAVVLALFRELFTGYVDDGPAIAELQALGADVFTEPRGLYLLRQFTGDRVAERVTWVQCIGRQFNDHSLGTLEGLDDVESLMIISPNVSDVGLSHLTHLRKLTGLYLGDTRVTEEGVNALRRALPGLRGVGRETWKNPTKPWAAEMR